MTQETPGQLENSPRLPLLNRRIRRFSQSTQVENGGLVIGRRFEQLDDGTHDVTAADLPHQLAVPHDGESAEVLGLEDLCDRQYVGVLRDREYVCATCRR